MTVPARSRSAPDSSPSGQAARTLSTTVYRALRTDVLAGRLKPGEKLQVDALARRFAVASTPIREALNRLASEGFVELKDQRGFRVAPVSAAELSELVSARCLIDGAALTTGIRRQDRSWEEGLVLALHRLSRASRSAPADASRPEDEWEQLHRDFHRALVSGCGSRWVERISAQLFDAAERYRLLAASGIPERNELDEHRAIVDACLARRADEAVALLERHYGETFAVIMRSPGAPRP